jgi:N-acetylglucosaminyldiphosphoundecaprenol N-acetyl-beta-D-mannosaminyltransferase
MGRDQACPERSRTGGRAEREFRTCFEQKRMPTGNPTSIDHERVLGISFFNGTPEEAVEQLKLTGGLAVMPASPALIKLNYDTEYRLALQKADLALADSGLLVLLWKLARRRLLRKISGITYLKCLLSGCQTRKDEKLFWIVSSEAAKHKAITWLQGCSFPIDADDCYVADRETPEHGHALLFEIEKRRPRHVIIATRGTAQEKLGLYLRDFLLYRPSIHCVGAALGFLTGEERPIPEWAERYHMGWFSRLMSQPRMLLPRIGIAFALARMVFMYRSELPPLRPRWTDV